MWRGVRGFEAKRCVAPPAVFRGELHSAPRGVSLNHAFHMSPGGMHVAAWPPRLLIRLYPCLPQEGVDPVWRECEVLEMFVDALTKNNAKLIPLPLPEVFKAAKEAIISNSGLMASDVIRSGGPLHPVCFDAHVVAGMTSPASYRTGLEYVGRGGAVHDRLEHAQSLFREALLEAVSISWETRGTKPSEKGGLIFHSPSFIVSEEESLFPLNASKPSGQHAGEVFEFAIGTTMDSLFESVGPGQWAAIVDGGIVVLEPFVWLGMMPWDITRVRRSTRPRLHGLHPDCRAVCCRWSRSRIGPRRCRRCTPRRCRRSPSCTRAL